MSCKETVRLISEWANWGEEEGGVGIYHQDFTFHSNLRFAYPLLYNLFASAKLQSDNYHFLVSYQTEEHLI